MKHIYSLLLLSLALFAASTIHAQTQDSTLPKPMEYPARTRSMAAGLEATLPMMGLSAIVNIDPKMSAQGIAGFFMGNVKAFVGRFLYHFNERSEFQPYAFGSLGTWSYSNETTFGIGGGGGIEYFLEPNPNIGLNLEVSLIAVNFKTRQYNITGITVGGGAHYYF